jgi:hypothetical protein
VIISKQEMSVARVKGVRSSLQRTTPNAPQQNALLKRENCERRREERCADFAKHLVFMETHVTQIKCVQNRQSRDLNASKPSVLISEPFALRIMGLAYVKRSNGVRKAMPLDVARLFVLPPLGDLEVLLNKQLVYLHFIANQLDSRTQV